MRQDRIMTVLAILSAFIGFLAITSGKLILAAVMLVLAGAIILTRGTGSFNERSQYEKQVATNGLEISDVYELFRSTATPLGKAWIGVHEGYPGYSVIFGPGKYNDTVVISLDGKTNKFSIKLIDRVENVRALNEEDEKRFGRKESSSASVDPARYSEFAAYKLSCTLMLSHLADLLEKKTSGEATDIPSEIDCYNMYYYNSSDGYVRDGEGSAYMQLEGSNSPFAARVYDADGGSLSEIVPRSFDRKGNAVDRAGFDMYSEGELFADVRRIASRSHDTFEIKSDGEIFTVENFAAVQRANIKSNYIIKRNDCILAVIAGNPALGFESEGTCRHYLILSSDDDYLVLYASFINFLMTINSFIR